MRLDYMDESLPSHQAVIASAQGWPIQDSEQIRDLPRNCPWPGAAVIVNSLVYATSHGQSEPGWYDHGRGEPREEVQTLH